MTKINGDTVNKLATLSRLEFNGREKEEIISDLNKMLDFVSKLNELDTSGVEPLIYMSPEKRNLSSGPLKDVYLRRQELSQNRSGNDRFNNLRTDEVKQNIMQKDALSNTPKKDSDYFKVPKVVEKK